MNKTDIAKRIARQSRLSQAEAADRLDRLILQIRSNLRKGRETSLPGLGKLIRGQDGRLAFDPEGEKRHD
jgi:nucleoid DNA-binding protein